MKCMTMLGQRIDAARLTSEYSYWQALSREPKQAFTFQKEKLVVTGEPHLVSELLRVSVTETGAFIPQEASTFTLTKFYDVYYVSPSDWNHSPLPTNQPVSVVADARLELWMKPLFDRRQCQAIIANQTLLQGEMWSWIHQVTFEAFTYSDLLPKEMTYMNQTLPSIEMSYMKHAGLRIEEAAVSYEHWQTEWLQLGMDMLNEIWLYQAYPPRPYFKEIVKRLIQLERLGTINLYETRDVTEWLNVLRKWGRADDSST